MNAYYLPIESVQMNSFMGFSSFMRSMRSLSALDWVRGFVLWWEIEIWDRRMCCRGEVIRFCICIGIIHFSNC